MGPEIQSCDWWTQKKGPMPDLDSFPLVPKGPIVSQTLIQLYNQFIIIKIATVNYSSVLFYGDTLRNTKTKGIVLQSLSVTNKNHWYGVMGL